MEQVYGTPDQYHALMRQHLQRANAAINDGIKAGKLGLSTDPEGAFRQLGEFWFTSLSGSSPLVIHPISFARSLHVLAFDLDDDQSVLAASWPHLGRILAASWPHLGRILAVSWPYSPEAMRTQFVNRGLTGDLSERYQMGLEIAELLIGDGKYKYTLVRFAPPLEDLRLFGDHQLAGWQFSASNGESSTSGQVSVLFDGSELRTEMIVAPEATLISRDVRLARKLRRSKQPEEWSAGLLFVVAYNDQNGTDFMISAPPDDRDADLFAGPLRIQIVNTAPKSAWQSIAKQNEYHGTEHRDTVYGELMLAIKNKQDHRYSNAKDLILLLDGGLMSITKEAIAEFTHTYRAELSSTSFKEIWYVSRIAKSSYKLGPNIP